MTRARAGIGWHHSASMLSDEWLTPPEIIRALGAFDLDPCCPPKMPWPTAGTMLSESGLLHRWAGRVWLNPPYGLKARAWLNRLAAHGNGIALTFARTETEMFFEEVWERAQGILFLRGRLNFYYASGERSDANAGSPSCLIAYGEANLRALERSGIKGKLIALGKDALTSERDRVVKCA